MSFFGLSPLARGTLLRRHSDRDNDRFIPAGAGNTVIMCSLSRLRAVYPRWRGEHFSQNISVISVRGLSPLARGTRDHGMNWELMSRFIPAGAGNTSAISEILKPWPVYPRWRGEHCGFSSPSAANGGLSPLARGTPCCHQRRTC